MAVTDTSVMEAARSLIAYFGRWDNQMYSRDQDALDVARALIRMHAALERLASSEAFLGARALDADRDDELIARMKYASAALSDESGQKS